MTDRTPSMTHATCMPVVDNTNIQTAGPRGPALLQDIWLIEKMAHSAVGKQTPLFVPTSAPTAYGVIE
jgi:catalase